MSASVTSFKIWAIAIFLNAFFFGIIELLSGDIWAAMGSVIIFMMGYVIGLPLWLLIWVLTEVILNLPYTAAGRICWLVGVLAVFVALFYAVAAWIVFGDFTLNKPYVGLLTGTTIAALITALCWNRKSFVQHQ